MDAALILGLITLQVATIIMLARWCASGGTPMVLFGLVVSEILGPVFGVPVYAVTVLILRWRKRRARGATGL